MNASVDRANVQATVLSNGSAPEPAAAPAADKICWLEVRQAPYHPSQQVELLHLQAEAEALLLQLQAKHQRRQSNPDGVVAPAV